MGYLRAIFILVGFLLLTLPLMPLQFFLGSKRLPWIYHRLLCKLLGVKIALEGEVPKGAALLVSNHVSWLDIPILSSVLPVSFVAKREVGTWPLFGALAKLQGTVFVNRENRHSTGGKRNELAARLLGGDCLVLFPEGTSSDGTAVLPFKSSYFGAAEGLETPVVPVTLYYEGPARFYAWFDEMELAPHIWQVVKAGRLKVRVVVHSPLLKADRKSMARNAETQIARSLGELSQIR